MKPFAYHDEARREIEESVEFYENRRPGTGMEFLNAVNLTLDRIARNPAGFSNAPGSERRRCLVNHYPYMIVYAELDDFLWVCAVAHSSRKSLYWADRSPED